MGGGYLNSGNATLYSNVNYVPTGNLYIPGSPNQVPKEVQGLPSPGVPSLPYAVTDINGNPVIGQLGFGVWSSIGSASTTQVVTSSYGFQDTTLELEFWEKA